MGYAGPDEPEKVARRLERFAAVKAAAEAVEKAAKGLGWRLRAARQEWDFEGPARFKLLDYGSSAEDKRRSAALLEAASKIKAVAELSMDKSSAHCREFVPTANFSRWEEQERSNDKAWNGQSTMELFIQELDSAAAFEASILEPGFPATAPCVWEVASCGSRKVFALLAGPGRSGGKALAELDARWVAECDAETFRRGLSSGGRGRMAPARQLARGGERSSRFVERSRALGHEVWHAMSAWGDASWSVPELGAEVAERVVSESGLELVRSWEIGSGPKGMAAAVAELDEALAHMARKVEASEIDAASLGGSGRRRSPGL